MSRLCAEIFAANSTCSKGMSKGWKYFFPTDSHVVGMMAAHYYKLEVERHNYGKNFIDVSNPTPLVDQSKINK